MDDTHDTTQNEPQNNDNLLKNSFSCKFCLKSFSLRGNCTQHERTHTGETPFLCKFCAKPFARKYCCKTHERTHTGEKPFQCTYCLKLFGSLQSCNEHIRTHTGERPYSCKFCSKTFVQYKTCSLHERTHTGEKPYTCKVCSKSFSQMASVNKHEKTHENGRLRAKLKRKSTKEDVLVKDSNVDYIKEEINEPKFQDGYHNEIKAENNPENEARFYCQFCNQYFNTNYECLNHEHSEEKPFVKKSFLCKFDEKKFTLKADCTVREKHTDDKSVLMSNSKDVVGCSMIETANEVVRVKEERDTDIYDKFREHDIKVELETESTD